MSAHKLAVYWDFENLHISAHNERYGPDSYKQTLYQRQERLLNISLLMEYIYSVGDVVINRAYNNWQSFASYRDDLLIYAIDLIQLYPKGMHAKNGADIRLALDALEDATLNPHITHTVIIGGDSDYIAVAQKLKRLGKFVIGIGMKKTTNAYWTRSCNEFKFYETLLAKAVPSQQSELPAPLVPTDRVKDFASSKELLLRAVQRLMEEEDADEVLKAKVRPMMSRLDPEFDPGNYNFATFNAFLTACSDVIQSRRGDYDLLISLSNREATKDASAPPLVASDGSLALGEAAATPKESLDLTDAMCLWAWSVQANIFGSNTIMLTDIGVTMRLLDPVFDFKKYGYTKSKGIKSMAEDAQVRGLTSIAYDPENNVHIITTRPGLASFLANAPKPEHYDQARIKRMLAKLVLLFKPEDIRRVLSTCAQTTALSRSRGETLGMPELHEKVCEALVDEANKREKWVAITTLLQRSGVLLASNGEPVNDSAAPDISSVLDVDEGLSCYLMFAQRQLHDRYQEEVEIDTLRLLL